VKRYRCGQHWGRSRCTDRDGTLCGSCGTELAPDSRFCNKCGAPVRPAATSAEYKQVTVLFADVVHSMDLAAAVGAERLREIMADLADRAAVVAQHFGGVMAVFGASVALEDHAVRACLAALGVQEEAKRLALEVHDRDGVPAPTAGGPENRSVDRR
jgi:adenylate cyclase